MKRICIIASLLVASCSCPEEEVGFQQFTPNYMHYSEETKKFIQMERLLADQIFSAPRHKISSSPFLQELCFRVLKDTCIVVDFSGDLVLYYPGKGMLLSPSIIKISEYQSELVSLLNWEYNRRILRLPIMFKNQEFDKDLCFKERPDPSPNNLADLTKLTFASSSEINPRALPLVLDELKARANCRSIGYFVFKKNYYFNLMIGELRRKYADQKTNITTYRYKKFYEQYFKNRS